MPNLFVATPPIPNPHPAAAPKKQNGAGLGASAGEGLGSRVNQLVLPNSEHLFFK